jgi:hypothetical protein
MRVHFLAIGFRVVYILRGRWRDIVMNVHVPTEDKCDYTKHTFCEDTRACFRSIS